ncbi:WSC domain-containing protein 2-like [Daphnia pulicaria]|uniref:WSC domain-containing protein 2-like n=1 Tax=Daphnia pulicaria TaxID=35523 RepID=UPI001EEB4203|nr:WSC domain-containing protein 2-like [Daphnia pulicaria]
MFHRRRLSVLQYVLLGIFFGSSVYLWTNRIGVTRPFNVIHLLQNENLLQETEESTSGDKLADGLLADDNSIQPMADPLSINVCPDPTVASPIAPVGIEPFPELKLDEDDGDLNRTLDWLDLWNEDGNCTKYESRVLQPGSQPQTGALVSFPGSGNSWLRMLLVGVTGVFISSIYPGEDSQFKSKANTSYQIPVNCGCTLLQKTHDFSLDAVLYRLPEAQRTKTLEEFKGKGILIIRNPFKAIRSYRNFEYSGMVGAGVAPENAFTGEKWDNFVSRSVAGWETLASVWIRGLKQGGVIYYERLHRETRSELKRLLKMLGLRYDKDRLECVLRHTADNSFKRESNNATQTEDPYTASQRLLIHKAIDSVQLVLKERGLDPLPVQYYDFYDITPEYGIPT